MTTVETVQQHEALVESLLDPSCWPAGGDDRRRIDTHISTVVLAGDRAYKLKKPLDLGFLDFLSLDARRDACAEEIRLNRRLAPQIYLAAVPVTGSIETPRIGEGGDPIDWAVQMRRFDPDAILSMQHGRVDAPLIDRLASRIAQFHADASRCPEDAPFGSPEQVLAPMLQNFEQIRATGQSRNGNLDALAVWTRNRHAALAGRLAARRAEGHVRECHGDLHLGNVALIEDEPVVFDAIEFNPGLRWIDTCNDLAFLCMDLWHSHPVGLGNRLLDRYLGETGDYDALPLLRFYAVYRALVRGKIAAIRLGQVSQQQARKAAAAELGAYIALAARLAQAPRGAIAITHGVSGSGKSFATASLTDTLPAIRLRSDVERKRLLGLAAGDDAGKADGYSAHVTEQTYARLRTLARTVAVAGYVAVVDATFLSASRRAAFRALAAELGVGFAIIDCDAPVETLRQRILARHQDADNVSDADFAVLERQLAERAPLTAAERALSIKVVPGKVLDAAELADRLAP